MEARQNVNGSNKKKSVTEKPWQNMLHEKTIPSLQNLEY